MTDQQFSKLTPRQFHLLLDRHHEALEHNKLLFGVVAAAVANFGVSSPKTIIKPSDFFASHRPDRRKADDGQISRMRQILMLHTTKVVKRNG